MGVEILVLFASAVLSSLGFVTFENVDKLVRNLLGRPKAEESYSNRLTRLTDSLAAASKDVDTVLAEIAQVARAREAAVRALESDLSQLEAREGELKESIEALQRTPVPVAEHFAKLIESGERRGARRDYVLFGAGVAVTTAISVALQFVFGG